MSKYRENRLNVVQLQLEEAVQMLKLVAASKRTSVEVAEWLELNYPENSEDNSTLKDLMAGSIAINTKVNDNNK